MATSLFKISQLLNHQITFVKLVLHIFVEFLLTKSCFKPTCGIALYFSTKYIYFLYFLNFLRSATVSRESTKCHAFRILTSVQMEINYWYFLALSCCFKAKGKRYTKRISFHASFMLMRWTDFRVAEKTLRILLYITLVQYLRISRREGKSVNKVY